MFERVSNIFSRNYCANIWEKIYVISKVQFNHEGGLSESRYFELFFSTCFETQPHKKNSPHWGPLLAFSNVWRNICKFCLLDICCNFVSQKSGSWPCHRSLNFDRITFFHLEIRPYFWTFFGLKNVLIATLTYSALQYKSQNCSSWPH